MKTSKLATKVKAGLGKMVLNNWEVSETLLLVAFRETLKPAHCRQFESSMFPFMCTSPCFHSMCLKEVNQDTDDVSKLHSL